MNSSLARMIRIVMIGIGALAYPILAHYSTTPAAVSATPWFGVVISLTPALAILIWLTWKSSRKPAMLLLCALIGAGLWVFWDTLLRNFSWVYFLQHAGTNLVLAAVFGTTLERGRQPLCTRFAEVVHGHLEPEVIRYTRQLTLAWTLFFISLSVVSATLFFFARIETWSIFANFLSLPLVALMFVVEYAVRLRKLPQHENRSILDGIRAFRKMSPARSTASSESP